MTTEDKIADEFVIVARPTVMSGLCLDWYRSERAYEYGDWFVSASRDGVLVANGTFLHTVPEEALALADSAYRLLRTRNDRDRELARGIATHETVGQKLGPRVLREGATQ